MSPPFSYLFASCLLQFLSSPLPFFFPFFPVSLLLSPSSLSPFPVASPHLPLPPPPFFFSLFPFPFLFPLYLPRLPPPPPSSFFSFPFSLSLSRFSSASPSFLLSPPFPLFPIAPPAPPAIAITPCSFTVEILYESFLVMFAVKYFTGKCEKENIALSWMAQFVAKESIFRNNFSLLGISDDEDDSPLLPKEGKTTFKFYASERSDEISFEVYMNDDTMDHVVFALAKKKVVKAMHKDVRDL
ncbi:hypothetical protein Fmac_032646 [Flemingia macrophylla]|uniref:Uncharacterized protein n=1 Tax=Flemingia macrophylla TaxID=520843 RepID=A0ABD1L6X8_9FABA